MRKPTKTLALVLFASLPALVWAHPGHGSGGFLPGFLHPFFGWDHLLAMLAVGVWAAQLGGRALWAVPLAFVTAMALGAWLATQGYAPPLVEPMIAATLLLLGLLVGTAVRLPAVLGAMLAGLFALAHGMAHVTDAAAQASLLNYAAGFLGATALLHAAGIGAALLARARPAVLRLAAMPVALAGAWLLATRVQ